MIKEMYEVNGKTFNLKEAVGLIQVGKWDAALSSISKVCKTNAEDSRKIGVMIKQDIKNQPSEAEREEAISSLLVTSGYNFEGYKITKYIDVINKVIALGTGGVSELGSSIADLAGGESVSFSAKIESARSKAYSQLASAVVSRGGNAVIGMDYEYFSLKSNIICVCAKGTAVVIE